MSRCLFFRKCHNWNPNQGGCFNLNCSEQINGKHTILTICGIRIKLIIPDCHSGDAGGLPAYRSKIIFKDIHYKHQLSVMVEHKRRLWYRILIAQDVEYLRCYVFYIRTPMIMLLNDTHTFNTKSLTLRCGQQHIWTSV